MIFFIQYGQQAEYIYPYTNTLSFISLKYSGNHTNTHSLTKEKLKEFFISFL